MLSALIFILLYLRQNTPKPAGSLCARFVWHCFTFWLIHLIVMFVMEFPNSNRHSCRFSSTLNEGWIIHQMELLIFDFHLTLGWSFLNFKYKQFGVLWKFQIETKSMRTEGPVRCWGQKFWNLIENKNNSCTMIEIIFTVPKFDLKSKRFFR